MHNGRRGAYVIQASGGWVNQQLTKDCGIIPYLLYKNHGFHSVMVHSSKPKPEEFPYLEKYLRGMEMDSLPEDSLQGRLEYINSHAADMDLLIFYGAYQPYPSIAEFYKKVRPDGKIYCATDMNLRTASGAMHIRPEYIKFAKNCDVVATSCRVVQKNMSAKWNVPVELIRNGWYNFPQVSFDNLFEQKENIILMVGRVGDEKIRFTKRTDILMAAFAKVADQLPNWKLRLVGNIHKSFEPYMEKYFADHPNLKDRVIFTDLIEDKTELANEYKRAKIFCLTSPSEGGTPNVTAEALFAGDFMIFSAIDAAYEATDDNKCGRVFPIGDIDALAKIFLEVCPNEDLLLNGGKHAVEYARRNFDAEHIVARLHYLLYGGGAQ